MIERIGDLISGIRYKKETEVVTFQGKEIMLENFTPIFTPEQEAAKRRELEQQLYDVFRKYANKRRIEKAISPEQFIQISGYLDSWDSVSFDDKRRVVDLMITTIAATSEAINITWKI